MRPLAIVFLLSLLACSTMVDRVFKIPDEIYQHDGRKPVKHEGHYDPITETGIWINYLVVDLPYKPIKNLRREVEETFQVDLSITEKKRGKEAHLTILTPPEYWKLHSHLKMQEINQTFLPKVQSLKFRIKCLAMAEKDTKKTFFLVAESESALLLRKEIHQLFIKNGGNANDFDPEDFYPHITIGFTQRDLHEKDQILKSDSYCAAKIQDKYTIEENK